MKSTTNVFQEGLRADLHPLSTSQKQLTDALNATLITYNGNEMMLQNDMGNTLIQDSKTGHIMGLSEGFVPVGLKEHGGIMYVVSANKDGVGEIGTIPSPVLKLELRKEELSQTEVSVATNAGPVSTMVGITDFKVYPGEKFLPALNLTYDISEAPATFKIQNVSPVLPTTVMLKERLISTITEGKGGSHDGLYELKLFSIYGSSATELKHVQKKQARPYSKDSNDPSNNPFWFYKGVLGTTEVDVEKTWLNKGFHSYPGNLPPGRLAIKAELEQIEYFGLPTISQSSQSKQKETKAPYITKQNDDYYLCFPGFEYKTHSIRFIGGLEITLTNQSSGKIEYDGSITNFATVNIGEEQTQYYYQIQSSRQFEYKKIEPKITPQDDIAQYFAPLFRVDIGKELNAWYRLEVKYTDIYGGYIDTFVYSFNPYHILNFDESYYGIEWKADTLKMQKAVIGSSQSSYSGGETVSFGDDDYYDTSSSWGSDFNGQSGNNSQLYSVDDDGYVRINSSDFKDSDPTNSTKSKTMKAVYTKYLYGNTELTKNSSSLEDYQYSMITARPTEYFKTDNISIYNKPDGFHQLDSSDGDYGSHFWDQGSSQVNLNFAFNQEEPIIKYNLPISAPGLDSTLAFFVGIPSGNDDKSFIDWLSMEYKFGAPVAKENEHWLYRPGNRTYYTDDAHAQAAKSVVFQYKVPNQSIYSLIPSFSLFGDTDEKLGLRLGLDRKGQPKEAQTVDQNLYQVCMPDKNTSETGRTSSFEKNVYYYNQSDKGNNLVLDSGVYLITVDAGVFNSIGKYYAEGKIQPDNGNQYGCNTNWDDNSDFWPTSSPTTNQDPRIAVFVHDIPYQIARVDSYINKGRRRTFMPTLLYLPKQSIIRIEWKYVEKLQNIGVFRMKKPVVFNNGNGFDEGDDIRIMYYQHPDLREIILPLEATYQEYAKCLYETYDYYPGLQSLSSINRHVLIDNVQFCEAPDRKGTWAYNYNGTTTDPTYLWDSSPDENVNGTGLMEFVYQYDSTDPVISTEIPKVDSLQSNRLEYRKLNLTT